MDFSKATSTRFVLALLSEAKPGGTPKRAKQARRRLHRDRLRRWISKAFLLRSPEQIGWAYTHASERRRGEAMGLKYPAHLEHLLQK